MTAYQELANFSGLPVERFHEMTEDQLMFFVTSMKFALENKKPSEYQCFYLNPSFKLGHDDEAEVLFESNNLGECCSFVYKNWKINKKDIAVYQASSGNYREVYQNKRRNAKGQFA